MLRSPDCDDAVLSTYKGYRFPRAIIAHCVWLYSRFTLSLREIELLMAARGVEVSYEAIRACRVRFGPGHWPSSSQRNLNRGSGSLAAVNSGYISR